MFLIEVPRAIGGGEGGRASLAVPGDVAVLSGAADGEGVDAVGVAIAVTAVLLPPSVPRSPHKDGAQTATTLENMAVHLDTWKKTTTDPCHSCLEPPPTRRKEK